MSEGEMLWKTLAYWLLILDFTYMHVYPGKPYFKIQNPETSFKTII